MKKIIGLVLGLVIAVRGAFALDNKPQYGQSFAPLVEKLMPKVVNISTEKNMPGMVEAPNIRSSNEFINNYFLQDEGGKSSLGSGFIIDSKGYILTNNHVIDKADKILVKLWNDKQFEAQIVGTDEMTDLALIKIETNEILDYANLGNSDDIRVGDWILAIGNPFGLGGSVSAGIVSAKSRDIDAGSYDNFIQTDAAINQGSSGGPLFDMNGDVIGIKTAIFSTSGASMGVGFATPVNLAKFVAEQLIAKGKVERGWIGINVTNNNQEIVLSDSQNFVGGVVVSTVKEDAPAAKSGIEAGDIIIAFNGKDVIDAKSFSRQVAETTENENIILRIWRNNQIKDLTVKVTLRPEQPKQIATTKTNEEKPTGLIDDLGLVIKEDNGKVVVDEVLADGNAINKGIKSGDELQKIDNNYVVSIEDVKSFVDYAKHKGNNDIKMQVLSDNQPQELSIGF